jgi:antitoxin ChpS
MHTTNLRKVGGSIMLAVPPALLDNLGLRAGTRVGIAIERGRLVVIRQKRPRYTLDQLLAETVPKRPRTRRDQGWLAGNSVGRELI